MTTNRRPSWHPLSQSNRASNEELRRAGCTAAPAESLKALEQYQALQKSNPFLASEYLLSNTLAISAGHLVLDEVAQLSGKEVTPAEALALIEGPKTP